MDMEVVGRHALLFDDDAMAAFVNSKEALVEWNSLLIDRYDVRHLLHAPPPPLKRKRHPSDPLSLEESQLDQDRYLDLPPPSDDSSHQENGEAESAGGSSYHTVAFSYGNTDISTDPKNSDVSAFLPPFSVPEDLLPSLPPTEKLHQIMARTAIFVSEHGGQSEIVLRVKQGSNTTFGFLMPGHQFHPYFRFLVDHPELLKPGASSKEEDKKANQEHNQDGVVASEALSLLGSVYGSGEDEDAVLHFVSEPKENEPGHGSSNVADTSLDNVVEWEASSKHTIGKDLTASKHSLPAAKENGILIKKTHPMNGVSSRSTSFSKKKDSDVVVLLPGSVDKPQPSTLPTASKVEPLIVEPPSDLKRMVEKIVEFILKNGKEFEAVLVEQDRKNGRFPFLLPSNQYHPYYSKILQKAQEAKQVGKSYGAEKPESLGNGDAKTSASSKKTDTLYGGYASHDFPYDSEKKEKFKMVIGGSKKDANEPTQRPAQQCGLSVDAAAAILKAATRGLRNPDLDILPKGSLDNSSLGVSSGGPASSLGNISFPSQINSSMSKPVTKGEASLSIPVELSASVSLPGKDGDGARDVIVAKVIAKTAALAAASEADSSEACLTKEQKLKAERLKRAKMFAAMIKTGAALRVNGALPRLSAEPPDPVISNLAGSGCNGETQDSVEVRDASNLSGGDVVDILDREREGSSFPVDVNTLDRLHKPEKNDSDDEYKERRTRMKKHLRSRRVEEEEEEEDEDERNHKHSRKKHRSHHSSHHSKDEHKHRKRHSSKDRESRHRYKYHSPSEDEQRYQSRSDKHQKSRRERKVDSEDESSRKLSDESNTSRLGDTVSREASVDLKSVRWVGSAPLEGRPSEPSQSTEVPDDLRAKVRAMLLATL